MSINWFIFSSTSTTLPTAYPYDGTDVELWEPSIPGSTEKVTPLDFLIFMFEGDRELTWLSYPSFAICHNATSRFLAFLWIARSSRDFRGVGDSAVGSPTTSVWDSSVGTSSFVIGNSAVGTTSSAVGDSEVGTHLFVIGDSAVVTISSAVGDSAVGTPSFTESPCSNVGLVENV